MTSGMEFGDLPLPQLLTTSYSASSSTTADEEPLSLDDYDQLDSFDLLSDDDLEVFMNVSKPPCCSR